MRLGAFILGNMEAILAEWESFAATRLPAAARMAPLALRDHAQFMLEAIAEDLATPQTREEQSKKSKGQAADEANEPETAAQTHAVLRARDGFDINQLVAEYRALRASVLRRWIDAGPLEPGAVQDIVRFNEAIDQAVAESVGHFHAQVERSRNLTLGAIGHDMRSPLNTIVTTASYLAALNSGGKVSEAAALLIRSGASIRSLLDDLVDFNRTTLGLGLEVVPTDVDLGAVLAGEVEQLRGAHPHRRIDLETAGDLRGRYDGARLQQLLRNLVSNAIKHGAPDAPVRVTLHGAADEIRLAVANTGPAIDPASRRRIFDPLVRGAARDDGHDVPDGLGLGLFIVREIAHAHGGEVDVRSEAGETTFTVRLPRAP